MGGSLLDVRPLQIIGGSTVFPVVVRPTRIQEYTTPTHSYINDMFTLSLFSSRPCVEEPMSWLCPTTIHYAVVPSLPKILYYCIIPTYIIHNMSYSPFILGLKVITYDIPKSVAA